MAAKEQARSQGRGAAYPKRLPFYDNEDGMQLLHRLALRRGVKAAALLRMLVREEAERVGLPASSPAPEEAPTVRPIWEEIDAAMRALPESVLDTLPTDLAEQHDHYLYGAPKR
jgi:hypothetical protein